MRGDKGEKNKGKGRGGVNKNREKGKKRKTEICRRKTQLEEHRASLKISG